jgi:hypothetical protein
VSFCVNHYSTVKKINEEWYGGTVPEPRGTMGVSIAASAARNWRSSANPGTLHWHTICPPFFLPIMGQDEIEDLKNLFPLDVSISTVLAY